MGSIDIREKTKDSLEWLACRYVLGELEGDSLRDFEHRLESEAAAQNAVVAAVESVAGIASTLRQRDERHIPAIDRRQSSRGRGWLAIGIALSLAFVAALGIGTYSLWDLKSAGEGEIAWAMDEEVLTEIAEEWSQVREETASIAGWKAGRSTDDGFSDGHSDGGDSERDSKDSEPSLEWLRDADSGLET